MRFLKRGGFIAADETMPWLRLDDLAGEWRRTPMVKGRLLGDGIVCAKLVLAGAEPSGSSGKDALDAEAADLHLVSVIHGTKATSLSSLRGALW